MGLRHPLLIHTFVFYVSHLDVARQPHLCNLLLGPAWKTSLCSIQTHTHRQERIMVVHNHSYLWASVSKWDNYRHPLTVIAGFLPLFQGPGNNCHVGLFVPSQWEDLIVSLGDCKLVCCWLNNTAEQPSASNSRFTLQKSFQLLENIQNWFFFQTVEFYDKSLVTFLFQAFHF